MVKRKRLAWKVFQKVGTWKKPTARAQSFGTSLREVASNHQVSCEFWRAKCLNGRNNYYLKTTAICCLFNNAKKACYPDFGEIVYFLFPLEGLGFVNPSFLFPAAVRFFRWRNGSKTLQQDFRCILRGVVGFIQGWGFSRWSLRKGIGATRYHTVSRQHGLWSVSIRFDRVWVGNPRSNLTLIEISKRWTSSVLRVGVLAMMRNFVSKWVYFHEFCLMIEHDLVFLGNECISRAWGYLDTCVFFCPVVGIA